MMLSVVFRLRELFNSVVSWLVLCWRISKLPGPPMELPAGHAKVAFNNTILQKAVQWERLYTHCQKFFMVMYPLVFVYSPEAVQAVLSKKQQHNDKGNVYHALIPLLGDGLISSKGEKWFRNRKMLTPAFHFEILKNFFEVFKWKTTEYLMELSNSPLVNDYGDICPYTRKLTLSFICETAMGSFPEEDKKDEEQILSSMHKLENIGMRRMIEPWLLVDEIFHKTRFYRSQERHKQVLHKFTNKLIKKRREEIKKRLSDQEEINEDEILGKKKMEIFLDLLILQQLQQGILTDDDIRDEVNTFMFAGFNTTQLATNFCIYLLGRHKEYQERAILEQDMIFEGSDREPTTLDLNRMVYLDRCIKEALRLFPSVPILARRLTEDLKIGEHTLPKNADCVLFPYVTHRNPEQFPNPEVFDPDNFLPERVRQRHPYSYFPFSAGPRNCIGQKFAAIAEKTVLSGLLRRFKIDSRDKPEDIILLPVTILVPEKGLHIKLIPREHTERVLAD